MERKLTEASLKEKFGPIYNFTLGKSKPSTNQKELVKRHNQVLMKFLVKNPSEVFRTGNVDLINSFLKSFPKYENNFKIQYPKKYERFLKAKREWKTQQELTVSKPIISNIFENLSVYKVGEIYQRKELKEIIDKIGFWERKLEQLNTEDNTDYQKLLKIPDKVRTVQTVTGIKRLLIHNFNGERNPNPGKEDVKKVYLCKDIDIHTHFDELPELLEEVLPFLVNMNTLQIGSIVKDMKSLPSQIIDLSIVGGNEIRVLPKDLFANLWDLKTLSIIGCKLGSSLDEDIFSNLGSLVTLKLQFCEITSLPPTIFRNLVSLKGLYLNVNKIDYLYENMFHGLSNLIILILHNNMVTGFPTKIFEGLTNLKMIDAQENMIDNIQVGLFKGLVNLEILNFWNNNISDLQKEVFKGLVKLKTIDLGNNQISHIPEGLFLGLKSLGTVDLTRNPLKPNKFPSLIDTGSKTLVYSRKKYRLPELFSFAELQK